MHCRSGTAMELYILHVINAIRTNVTMSGPRQSGPGFLVLYFLGWADSSLVTELSRGVVFLATRAIHHT